MTANYPDMMYAAIMSERGTIVYDLFPTPDPESKQVIVKVHVAAINFQDVLYLHNRYSIQKDLPHILGSDAVGEIVLLGADVTNWNIGDRVVFTDSSLGFDYNGTHAEYVAVDIDVLGRIPDNMDYRKAALLTHALARAWAGLTYNARLRKRETIVINRGASSPLGLSTLTVAKWKEATIIAVDRNEKAHQLREAGASIVLDETSEDVLTLVLTITEDKGASLVVDIVGQDTIGQSLELLCFDGRLLSLASYSGDTVELNLQDLMAINGSIVTPSDRLKDGDTEKLLSMIAEQSLVPVVDQILPLSKAQTAYTSLKTDTAFGTILLVPDSLF